MAINLQLEPKPGESQEKFAKRFFRKCKKYEILQEYLDRVSFHRTKSERRRFKKLKNRYKRKNDR